MRKRCADAYTDLRERKMRRLYLQLRRNPWVSQWLCAFGWHVWKPPTVVYNRLGEAVITRFCEYCPARKRG